MSRQTEVRGGGPNRTLIIAGVAVLVVLGGLIYLLFLNTRPAQAIEGLISYPNSQGNEHDINLTFEELPPLPPHGGPHNPSWQNCGVYREPVRPEHAIHSLEHGVVWISYRPDLDQAEVDKLEELVTGQSHLLLAPYPGLQSPIVLTTWSYQLEVDDADDDRIQLFIDRYLFDRATAPEVGASCSGQTGNPIDR